VADQAAMRGHLETNFAYRAKNVSPIGDKWR